MKTFKKVLASTLAAAMVVTALPVTPANAAAAPKLSATKATLYAGQSKTIKITTPKSWKSVKTTVSSSKKSVATAKKASTKKFTVKAVKAGTAKVTVKVTAKKSGKAVKKTLKATIKVKNPSLTLSAANEVAVGATEAIKATVKPSSTKVTYTSSDKTIATVDANGVVTGVKAGKVTITAKAGKTTKTVDMTVKTAILKDVAQKSLTTVEAVITGDTKNLKTSDFTITNTSNNVVYAVKEVAVDAKDATKVTLTTYMDMKDAKEYTVVFDGTTKKFTATDGVVAKVGLDKTQVDAATETEIKAVAMDAQGVVVDSKAYGDTKLSMTVNVTNGYMTGTKLYLNKAGDTATVDVTYHKGTFDSTGKEEVIENKGIVVTAVAPETVTVAGWAVKIASDNTKTFDTAVETKIAAGDTKTAYIQITNSKNEKSVDLTNYTLESSNKDALIVTQNSDKTTGKATLQAVKEGTSYIVVKDKKGAVVTTLPVTVVAARKATSIALDKTDVTLSNKIAETAEIKITVKDQYSEDMSIAEAPTFKTLTYTNVAGTTVNTDRTFDSLTPASSNTKFTVSSSGVEAGTYVVKVTANGLARTFTVNVVTTSATDKISYAFDMATTTADAVITKTATDDTKLTAKVYKLNAGVKTGVLGASNFTVKMKDSKGNDAKLGSDNAATATADGVEIKVNDRTNGYKLAAGTYTLTVTSKENADNNKPVYEFTRNIVITDSQSKVSVKRINETATSVGACFEFYLEGKKINPTVKYFNGTTDITAATGTTVPVTTAEVTYTYDSNTVIQTVNIGLTVTVQ